MTKALNNIPDWWNDLPVSVLRQFKLYVDVGIEARKPTAVLSSPDMELLCVAALSPDGLVMAKGLAAQVVNKYGKAVEVIVIAPDNYTDWFNEVIE